MFFYEGQFLLGRNRVSNPSIGRGNIDNSLLSRLDPCEVEEIYNEVWLHWALSGVDIAVGAQKAAGSHFFRSWIPSGELTYPPKMAF